MPRVDTTDVRRQKRDVQQRMSHLGRSSPLALYSPSTPTPPRSASAIVKLEPATTPIPSSSTASLKITIPAPVPATPASPRTWRHPAELPYIRARGKTWDDLAILAFLTAHAFSVPPRGASTADPWVHIICADGQVTVLPRGYRIPLLWVAKFQWTSLALVLSAHETIRKREWNNTKFEILHIARLCAGLLEGARAEMVGGGMDRGWRCAMFDRALRRYWHDWMIMRDEFVRDFWREFDEEEYEGDVLKLGWGQWVLKGHKGFTLTKQEVLNGITAQEFMEGLVVNQENSTFEWVEPDTPPPEVNMEVQKPEMPETHTTPMPTAEQTPAPLDPLPQVTVPESPTAEAPVPMSVDEQDQPPPMTPLQESTQPASPAHDLTPPPPQSEHAQDPTPPPPQPEQAPAAQVQPEIRPPVPPPNSSVMCVSASRALSL
ncbi:hypothetical protein B0H10DRAFT_107915 [Mycena sp. CBHHK59/15]|nr:hypothetical protein B0H10DRAFT_107915 [Mycena sp. CBHHK59/15]